MRSKLLLLLFAFVVDAPFAFALCAPKRPFCEALPDRSNPNAAIFVGLVEEIVTAPALVLPRAAPGNSSSDVAQGRLPSRRYPVVRLQVQETFSWAASGDFSMRLTSDVFVDGEPMHVPDMHPGELWLVEADRSPTDEQWYTSSCQRSERASEAANELLVLRTWAAGKTLPAHFSGQVLARSTSRYAPDVRVNLRGEKSFSAVSDSQGRFLIDNVLPGVYEASTEAPMDTVPLQIDLTKSWCAERTLFIK